MSSAKQLGAQLQNYLVEVGCMRTSDTCSMHDAMALAARVSPSLRDYKAYEFLLNAASQRAIVRNGHFNERRIVRIPHLFQLCSQTC
jgi:hypothetical protein